MATGTILRIVRARGFGFVLPSKSRAEVLFTSDVIGWSIFNELSEDQEVEFDVEPDPEHPNRSRASFVKPLKSK